MTESIRKTLLYFQPIRTYWNLTAEKKEKIQGQGLISFYPQSILPRIEQGHYKYFDKNGIPCFPNNKGIIVHHYTTLCSFALGMWEKYIETGQEEPKQKFLDIAEFLLKSSVTIADHINFLDFEDESESFGMPCAMNQGEAISVLVRAHSLTKRSEFLECAYKASKAFEVSLENGGVVGQTRNSNPWYLEAGKQILNGHCYATIGLFELYKYDGNSEVKKLFEQGVKSIESEIELFDTGFWSYYWLDTPRYIASIMYHNLHIIQLEFLGKVTNNVSILNFSKKLEKYGRSPINRIRSVITLIIHKIRK